jgi:hypothetical protein
LPEMQKMQPCARCEQELPESFFHSDDAMFCKRCQAEVNELLRKKYSVIEAAHIRAQLRRTYKQLRKNSPSRRARPDGGQVAAAAGD